MLFESISQQLGVPIWLISIALAWSLAWKGIALWKSARKNHIIWFCAFLLVHTLGILEILYIFLFSKINLNEFDKQKNNIKRKRK